MLEPEIVVRPIKVGATDFLPGDRFDPKRPPFSTHLDERQVGMIRRAGQVGPLTRESYAIALVRRPGGSPPIGRGFTDVELMELGIIDEPPKRRARTTPAVAPKSGEPVGEPIEIRPGYFLQAFERGHNLPPTFDLRNADGDLVRPARFGTRALAEAFLDKLLAGAAHLKAGKQESSANDVHVQPQPEHAT